MYPIYTAAALRSLTPLSQRCRNLSRYRNAAADVTLAHLKAFQALIPYHVSHTHTHKHTHTIPGLSRFAHGMILDRALLDLLVF